MIWVFGSHMSNYFKLFLQMKTNVCIKISAIFLVNPLSQGAEALRVWMGAMRLVIDM